MHPRLPLPYLLLITLPLTVFEVTEGLGSIAVTPPNTSANSGTDVYFNCEYSGTAEVTLEWYFVDHNLQISSGGYLLNDEDGKYSIQIERNKVKLMIGNVDAHDGGHYRCQVKGKVLETSSAVLVIRDKEKPPIPDNIPVMNETECCLKTLPPVSAQCLPACDPGSLDLDTWDSTGSCGIMDLPGLLRCGSDGRNHAPCCKRRMLPDICLPYCAGQIPSTVVAEHDECLKAAGDIVKCYMEGQHVLPSSPTKVSAVSYNPNSVTVTWEKPTENGASVTGYRVFYMKVMDANTNTEYRTSKKLGADLSLYTIPELQPGTRYKVYVIAFNLHGSSMPTSIVEITTQYVAPEPQPGTKDILECCKQSHVSPSCQRYICEGTMKPKSEEILSCFGDIKNIFNCMTGQRNHTSCCISRSLPSECLPICAGNFYAFNQWTDISCFNYMPEIRDCYLESSKEVPGPPQNVRLTLVTSDRAQIAYGPPLENADKVISYRIDYYAVHDVTPNHKVLTKGKDTTGAYLLSLTPNTLYKVSVTAVGSKSTSLPVSINFLTYSPPAPLPTGSTPVPPKRDPKDVTECCHKERVPDRCMSICSYEANITSLVNLDFDAFMGCEKYLGKILMCGADGRDHTDCCKRRQIMDMCLPFCAFNSEQANNFTFENKHLPCIFQSESIIECMKQGLETLPSEPTGLMIKTVTAHAATLQWRAPIFNANLVSFYLVTYWKRHHPLSSMKFERVKPGLHPDIQYILQHLQEDTAYKVTIMSGTLSGRSVPTPTIGFRTLPLPSDRPVFNGTFPANLTDCCEAANVSKECVPACAGNVALNTWNCSADFGKMVKCAAGGATDQKNHTQCCRSRNVPRSCLGYCAGAAVAKSYADIMCLIFTDQIFSCFKEGYSKLPSKPSNFMIVDVGKNYVKLNWMKPESNGDGVTYTLFYKRSNVISSYATVKNVTSPYKLDKLESNTHYDIFLVAENQYGTSQPTEVWTLWTNREIEPLMKVTQEPGGYHNLNGTVTLTCEVDAFPPPVIYWMRHGQRTNSSKYIINKVKATDVGKYTCITETSSTTSHHDAYVKVQYKPVAEAWNPTVTAYPNRDGASLQCVFHGYPTRMRWHRGNQELPADPTSPGRFRKFTEEKLDQGLRVSILNIALVTKEDYGIYTCMGSNSAGSDQKTVTLQPPAGVVPTLPTFTVPPKVVNVSACCINKGVHSQCRAACTFDVDLDVLDKLPNKLMCAMELPKLVNCAADGRNHTKCCERKKVDPKCYQVCSGIVNPEDVDPSLLDCLAHIDTIIGCMQEGHKTIPSPPRNLVASISQQGYMMMTWSPPAEGLDRVAEYWVYIKVNGKVQQPLKLNKFTTSYSVHRIKTGATYEVWVTAYNHYGQSHPSNVARATTGSAQDLTPSPPRFFKATLIDSNIVHLSWSVPLTNQGYILGYEITVLPVTLDAGAKTISVGNVFAKRLTDLMKGATYSMYVKAKTAHHSSKPSNVATISIPGDPQALPASGSSTSLTIGLAVFFILLILALVAVAGVAFWYFRLRKNTHTRFKDESVAFENPGYANSGGEGRVSGIPGGNNPYDNPNGLPPTYTERSDEELNTSAIMQASEDNGNTNPLYATIPTDRSERNGVAQIDTIDSGQISLKLDGTMSNM